MVKNNVEVIESHVRYNLNIFDGMIILDNGSTDGTLEVLRLLENEGLPVYVIIDDDREYEQAVKTNKLLLKAINEFDADIIIPLDSDEFLISENKGNPREILEIIEPDTVHMVKWKTYVPDLSEKKNERFIPKKITMARDDTLEEFYKVIIPKELVNDFDVQITFGNHDLIYNPQHEDAIKRVINQDLRIAHFPIVSQHQAITKVAIGWIYNIYRPGKTEHENFHLKIMFDILKEKGDLDDEDVMKLAKQYAIRDEQIDIKLKEDPLDISFCNDIEMKYIPDRVKPLSDILESCEWLAMNAANFKKQSLAEKRKLKNEIQDLSLEMDKQHRQMISTQDKLKKRIQRYESSNSWRVTAPLRKFGNIIKKHK